MAKHAKPSATRAAVVRRLVEVADADTVYRDVDLTRARTLLADELPLDAYRGLARMQQQIDEAVATSRAAAVLQNWQLVQAESAKAEQLRRGAEQKAALRAVGELVYDAPAVAVDPFSPGLQALAKGAPDLADLRGRTVAALAALADEDADRRAFYESRRAFFAGLTIASARKETSREAAKDRPVAELERLAADAATALEGAMKIESLVDQGTWPAGVSEHVKTLVGQFVRHAFVNSGGGRYRPSFTAESVLVEDFPEDAEPPAGSGLLAALGLAERRGLAREEIEAALLAKGPEVLRAELGLDPLEFRLVCVPQDLYSRVGRDRGWGAAEHWTHFDGYQVIKGGRLRALVGGDVRYGGLADLASIAASDRRESVIARFAVIRRARQVARWR